MKQLYCSQFLPVFLVPSIDKVYRHRVMFVTVIIAPPFVKTVIFLIQIACKFLSGNNVAI